jgi:hypothetical protein
MVFWLLTHIFALSDKFEEKKYAFAKSAVKNFHVTGSYHDCTAITSQHSHRMTQELHAEGIARRGQTRHGCNKKTRWPQIESAELKSRPNPCRPTLVIAFLVIPAIRCALPLPSSRPDLSAASCFVQYA